MKKMVIISKETKEICSSENYKLIQVTNIVKKQTVKSVTGKKIVMSSHSFSEFYVAPLEYGFNVDNPEYINFGVSVRTRQEAIWELKAIEYST
jgi:hypothetical protein